MLNLTEHESSTAHKTKTPTNTCKEASCFWSLRCCIYHADKCQNANIYEQDKFRAQLS